MKALTLIFALVACGGASPTTLDTAPGGNTVCHTTAGDQDCASHEFYVTSPDNTMTQCNSISNQCPAGWSCTITTPQGFVDGTCSAPTHKMPIVQLDAGAPVLDRQTCFDACTVASQDEGEHLWEGDLAACMDDAGNIADQTCPWALCDSQPNCANYTSCMFTCALDYDQ